MMALRVSGFSLITAIVVQCSAAVDEADSKATCGDGVAACEIDRFSILQVKYVVDEDHVEVAQLLHQASDCAGKATAFVKAFGEAWTNIVDLLLPQDSSLSQLIEALTPTLRDSRMEGVAALGIAERTKPQCPASLQQTNPSTLLEATQSLNAVSGEQVEAFYDDVVQMQSTAENLAKLGTNFALLQPLMCPAVTDYIKTGCKNTIETFEQHIRSLKRLVAAGNLLQVEGTAASMAQSLRRAESVCKGELAAFVAYAKDMVQYCTAIRDCKNTLYLWTGLDKASQKCIDVFSKYTMESEARVCKD